MLPLVKELIELNPKVNGILGSGTTFWVLSGERHSFAWQVDPTSAMFKLALQEDRARRLEGGFSYSTHAVTDPRHVINVLKRYKELIVHCTRTRPDALIDTDPSFPVYQYDTVVPGIVTKHLSLGSAYNLGALVHVAFRSNTRAGNPTYDCIRLRPETFTDDRAFRQREYYVDHNDLLFIADTANPLLEERLADLLKTELFLEVEHDITLGMMEFEVSACALPYFYLRTMLTGTLNVSAVRGSTKEIRLRRLIKQTRNEVFMVQEDKEIVPYIIDPDSICGPGVTAPGRRRKPLYLAEF
ncbi:MAG: hypothetical protein E6R03_10200 [Hyphomicrobiaceae bacterium]|nr:MAG: hypothetical protein E6R03_10200 [Hyphomicrobiaceae bacterium]